MKPCQYTYCSAPSEGAEQYCVGHQEQVARGETLRPLHVVLADGETECSFEGCWRTVYAKELCQSHYKQQLAGEELRPLKMRVVAGHKVCGIKGCGSPHKGGGLCSGHRYRLKEHGVLGGDIKKYDVGSWSDWFSTDKGYVARVRTDPVTKKRIRQLQHRYVMETVLGRPLRRDEEVHHRNAVRHDNRPENLELWSKSHPTGARAIDLLAWAREIVLLYEPQEHLL